MKSASIIAVPTLFTAICFAQNVGIGVVTPQYNLDVLNLVRINQSGNINPGFLLEGTTNISRAFVGMFSFNQAGIYGYNGAGYALVANINGNNGIGVENPGHSLDVNGRVRLRCYFQYKKRGCSCRLVAKPGDRLDSHTMTSWLHNRNNIFLKKKPVTSSNVPG